MALKGMMAFRGDINYGREFSLSWLLDETLGFEATDPRDMIYALLGLTTDDSRREIVLDYGVGNTPAEVYTQAMKFLFKKAGTTPPVALYRVGIGFSRSGKVQGLPSWVPDWSYAIQIRFLHDEYAAGTRYAFDARVGDNHNSSVISLRGEIFDTVQHLGPMFSAQDGETRLDEACQLQETYDKTYTLAFIHAFGKGQCSNESSFNEAFIRTLLGNKSVGGSDGRAFSSGLSIPQCHVYFEDMENYAVAVLAPSELALFFNSRPEKASHSHRKCYMYNTETEQQAFLEFHARMEEFQSLLGSSIGGRRSCVTKQGRMAVVPPLCEEGDLVGVFVMSMPFLLRETTARDTQSSGSQRYALVGCCYVDSAMEGQIEMGKGSMVTLM
ncbi:hypothetical protein V8F06_006154 [Rhypophila decipiens]